MKKLILIAITLIPYLSYSQVADSLKRAVRLEGAVNFRDLGGYETKDGKQVKWGKLYRSASISKITNEDLQKLNSLSIGYVVDFRGPKEVAAAPDKLPAKARYIQLQAGSESTGDTSNMRKMMQSVNDSGLLKYYTDLAPFKARYQPLFDQLLVSSPDSALLFHCSAGKDRTGIAAAFILYALGVSEEKIMEDYTATNYYRRIENEVTIPYMMKSYGISENKARRVMSADERYLSATFNTIRKEYGSIDVYLEKVLDVDPKEKTKLREKFVQ
jgi:protein-tyrosine phosphatase